MIYVPDLDNYVCYVIRDTNTLRAYKSVPDRNKEVEYRDYYINSHSLYQDGVQSFSNYSNLPVCLSSDNLTTAYGYRNDFADICIIFVILVSIGWFLISGLLKVLFKGRKLY